MAFLYVSRALPGRDLAELERKGAAFFRGRTTMSHNYTELVSWFKARADCAAAGRALGATHRACRRAAAPRQAAPLNLDFHTCACFVLCRCS